MFKRKNVDEVLDNLKKKFEDGYYLFSEAHLQMSFVCEAIQLYGENYRYLPEYPCCNSSQNNQREEYDLLIIDKTDKCQTLIEFKYKTSNVSKNSLNVKSKYPSGISFYPKNHVAQNLGRYDCWKDIHRIESFINGDKNKNGFFIFLSNDHLYWDEDSSFPSLSMRQSNLGNNDKPNTKNELAVGWGSNPPSDASIGQKRKKNINITKKYCFVYNKFAQIPYKSNNRKNSVDIGLFNYLVVDI